MARSERSLAQLRAIMLSYQRRGLVGPGRGGAGAKTFSRVLEGRKRIADELRQMRRNPEPDILHYQYGDKSWRHLALDKVNRMRRSRGKAPIMPGPDTRRVAGPSNEVWEKSGQKAWRFLDSIGKKRPYRTDRFYSRYVYRRYRPESISGEQLQIRYPEYKFDESGQLGIHFPDERGISGAQDLRDELKRKFYKRNYYQQQFDRKLKAKNVHKSVRRMAWGRPYRHDEPVKQSPKPDFPEWQTKPGRVFRPYRYRQAKIETEQPVQLELFNDIGRRPKAKKLRRHKEPFWDERQRQFQFGKAAKEAGVRSHIVPRSKPWPPEQLSLKLRKPSGPKLSGSQYKKERLADFKAGLQRYHEHMDIIGEPRGSEKRLAALRRIRSSRRIYGSKKTRDQLKYYGRERRMVSNPNLKPRRKTW